MSTITTERLTKILSETQGVISECNSRSVHGSVEVNARLFENVLMELLRHRAAMQGKADQVIPDSWVACSERMPEAGQYVLCLDNGDKYQNCIPDHDDIYTAAYCDRLGSFTTEYWGDHDWMSKRNPTHWSSLPDMPAAPQQEVKP